MLSAEGNEVKRESPILQNNGKIKELMHSYGHNFGGSFTSHVNSQEVLSCVNVLRAGEVGGLSSVDSDTMLNPHKTQRIMTFHNEDLLIRKSSQIKSHTDSDPCFPTQKAEKDSNNTFSLHSDLVIEDENGEKINAGGKVNPDKIMSGQEQRTNVLIKNIPCRYTQE